MARTGRPKRSRDILCRCRECGTEWLVPEWQKYGRDFCSRTCYYAHRRAHPQINRAAPDEKVCPKCGLTFLVGGVGRPRRQQVYCSLTCAGKQRSPLAREMGDTESAWLAGLFDGEGSIVMPNRKQVNSVRVSISNTHYPLLERVVEVTGTGSIIVQSRGTKNPQHAPSWYWQCYADNARSLLRQMLPWLIVKRVKAEAAIASVSRPPGRISE